MVDRSSPDIESVEMTIFKEMFNGLDLSDEVKMELSERANLHTIARNIRLSLQPARCSAGSASAAAAPDEPMIECPVCEGAGFSGRGTGYDDVCGECGGHGHYPADAHILDVAQSEQEPRLAERLTDVVMMLDTPDAYNREYIAAVCRSILSSVSSTPRETPHDR